MKAKLFGRFTRRLRFSAVLVLAVSILLIVVQTIVHAAQVDIDATVNIAATKHNGTSPTTVFTSDTVGYTFYVDSTGKTVYAKTTNGGTTWGAAVIVDAQTDCLHVGVWYDQWTPGNTTGTMIHIVTTDSGSDDTWYTRLNTANDTQTTTLDTSGINQGGTFTSAANLPTITESTDGTIYMAMEDASDSFMLTCSSACDTSINNWTEAAARPFQLANNSPVLVPLLSNQVMVIDRNSSNKLESRIWDGSAWDAAWTIIENVAGTGNATYDGTLGATVDTKTGNVYLTYGANLATPGTDDNIKTAVYDGSSWQLKSNVLTNSSSDDIQVNDRGVTSVKIAFNQNNSDVYVLYTAETTPGTTTTMNVYYKKSTDGMATWGAESAALNTTSDDTYGARLNITSNERIFATWYQATSDDLFGDTVADLVPPTYAQSGFRTFENLNSTDVGAASAAQNTSTTLRSTARPARLRMTLHVGGDGARAGLDSFKLQYAARSGSCDTGFSGESYADITSSTPIAYYNNAGPATGAALTANANDPVHGSDTVDPQSYNESNNFTNSQSPIMTGQDGMWDFSLKDNSAPASTAYCIRAVNSDNSLLSSYTVIPQITTSDGILGVDMVNSGGASLSSISIPMSSIISSFGCQTSTGTLGLSNQRIRVKNNSSTPGWVLSLAATDGNTALWSSGSGVYDYNDSSGAPSGCGAGSDSDTYAGLLGVNFGGAARTPQSDCTTTGTSLGAQSAFQEGVTDALTLMLANSGAETGCYWDITGIGLTQQIPTEQPSGTYSLNLTLTVVAN